MNKSEFLDLLDKNQPIIHKICRIYRNTWEDREDLFQEIVFQLWKSVPHFKQQSKISTWLYRVALNTAIATFRKKRPIIINTPELQKQYEDLADKEELNLHERLFEAMQKLDDAEKAIMTLYLENLSYQQIGDIIGINENYVGVKINRIKQKIKKLLNQ